MVARRHDRCRELFDEMKGHHKESANTLKDINITLAKVNERLKKIDRWAFAGNGERGMEARVKEVELGRATEHGERKGIKVFWFVLAAVLTLILGMIGAVVGVIGINAFWSD